MFLRNERDAGSLVDHGIGDAGGMRVLLLHNPTAGDGHPPAGELLRMLQAAGLETRYLSTKDPGFASAMGSPAELVIAAGGDGTVGRLAATLPDRSRPVAILPLGGANNIARSLGIRGAPGELIDGLHGAPVRRLDLAVARGPWGTRQILEGVGLGALVRSAAEVTAAQPPPESKIRAGREALRRRITDDPPLSLRLSLDGLTLENAFLMVEAMNVQTTGPSLCLAPAADPGDGRIDVVCIREAERAAMLAWLEHHEPRQPPPGEVRRGCKLGLLWTDVPLRLDDDLLDPPAAPVEVVVEIDPEPLRVLVPEPGMPPT